MNIGLYFQIPEIGKMHMKQQFENCQLTSMSPGGAKNHWNIPANAPIMHNHRPYNINKHYNVYRKEVLNWDGWVGFEDKAIMTWHHMIRHDIAKILHVRFGTM